MPEWPSDWVTQEVRQPRRSGPDYDGKLWHGQGPLQRTPTCARLFTRMGQLFQHSRADAAQPRSSHFQVSCHIICRVRSSSLLRLSSFLRSSSFVIKLAKSVYGIQSYEHYTWVEIPPESVINISTSCQDPCTSYMGPAKM